MRKTYDERPEVRFSRWWRKVFQWMIVQWLAGLALLLSLVTAEVLSLRSVAGAKIWVVRLLACSWLNAAVGWLELSPLMLLIGLVVAIFSAQVSRVVLCALVLFALLAQVLLTIYFAKTSVLFGSDFYTYSWKDVWMAAGSADGLSWKLIFVIIILLAVVGLGLWRVGRWARRRLSLSSVRRRWIGWIAGVMVFVGWVLLMRGWPGIGAGSSEYMHALMMDKVSYLLRGSWQYWYPVR